MKVVIPSKGRSQNCPAVHLFNEPILCVSELGITEMEIDDDG